MDEQNLQTPQAEVPSENPPKKSALLPILLGILFLTIVGVGGYYLGKSQTNQSTVIIPTVAPSVSLVPTSTIQDETTNWKIYKNDKYGFTLSFPPNLTVDLKNAGFISGSDYYGARDFNLLIYDQKIEPSHEGPASDVTGQSTWQYDGYNFAIFSGDFATKQLSNYLDTVKIGDKYSPPLEKEIVTVLGQEHPLYYLPPSNRPNTDKTSYWFTYFPLGNSTVIVTGNYNRMILRQILSTFKFLDQNQVSANCVKDSDCILVNKDSDYGCSFSGECQPIDYSLDQWISVNASSQQEYIKNKCPNVLKMGRPNCFPKPINDQYTSKCVSNKCQKVPI